MKRLNEIVVISGKGGTGKTMLTSSMVPFFDKAVIADCDVDAPDLEILFSGERISEEDFIGTKKPTINEDICTKCGVCYQACKFDAITEDIRVNIPKCEGCGVCEFVCPVRAISMKEYSVGKLFITKTSENTLVHARLKPGEETSGKLVTEVRKRAKQVAMKQGANSILIDGSPGIACNVISSITGVKKAVIVTEPTLSGLHDLKRVYEVTQKFRLPVFVVINKYDLSQNGSDNIEKFCKERNIDLALKMPFNKKVVEVIVKKNIPSLELKEFFEEIGFDNFIKKLKEE